MAKTGAFQPSALCPLPSALRLAFFSSLLGYSGRDNAVEDHDLLPDLARQTIRQVLDIISLRRRVNVPEVD